MRRLKNSLVLVLFLLAPLLGVRDLFAQPDTVPVLLQSRIVGASSIEQLLYLDSLKILLSNSSVYKAPGFTPIEGVLYHSYDDGQNWKSQDTGAENQAFNGYYDLVAGRTMFRLSPGTKIKLERSFDSGASWIAVHYFDSIKLHPGDNLAVAPGGQRASVMSTGIHTIRDIHDTTKFIDAAYPILYLTSDGGDSWHFAWIDTTLDQIETTSGASTGTVRWCDDRFGLMVPPKQADNAWSPWNFLALTTDGGSHWTKILSTSIDTSTYYGLNAFAREIDISYPTPSTIILRGGPAPWSYISRDTGKSWLLDDRQPSAVRQLSSGIWVGIYYADRVNGILAGPAFSTDQGQTWKAATFDCTHSFQFMSFRDAMHGIASDHWQIVARTFDGGKNWICQDTFNYASGTIFASNATPKKYYAFDSDTNYAGNGRVLTSLDRGAHWLYTLDTVPGYAFAARAGMMWLGSKGHVRYSPDRGGWLLFKNFVLSPRRGTFIKPISDNAVWVGNDLDLYLTTDQGHSWHTNAAFTIPNLRGDTSYRYLPLSSEVVFTQGYDTIYETRDHGISWQPTDRMPLSGSDGDHWVITNTTFSQLLRTADGGATYDTITRPPNFRSTENFTMIDPNRWFYPPYYTFDAGKSWKPIPGWNSGLHLYVTDSSTAFGFDGIALWRLDLPWFNRAESIVAKAESSQSSLLSNLHLYPQPAATRAFASFTLLRDSKVTLQLCDILGRIVWSNPVQLLSSGPHEFVLNLTHLPQGIYSLRIQTGDSFESAKVEIVR